MKHFLKEEALKKLEDAVTEIEKSTSAEIVIVIARSSEHYKDISLTYGFILSMIVLAFILLVPWLELHYYLVTPCVIISFFLGYFLCSHSAFLIRLLAGAERKMDYVKRGAKAAFFDEHVSATRNRTGILFYISLFERRVEILTDLGIDGKIPRDKWNRLTMELTGILIERESVDRFTDRLLKCIDFLSGPFPPGEENPDEIPNRPRVIG